MPVTSRSDVLHTARLETPLRELMTPGVVAVPEDASLASVFGAMRAHRVHAVLVTSGDDGGPLGWVTSRSLLAHVLTDLDLAPAGRAIDEPAVSLPPVATAAEAVELLRERDARRIAVCRAPARLPEGVVTDLDLVELLTRR